MMLLYVPVLDCLTGARTDTFHLHAELHCSLLADFQALILMATSDGTARDHLPPTMPSPGYHGWEPQPNTTNTFIIVSRTSGCYLCCGFTLLSKVYALHMLACCGCAQQHCFCRAVLAASQNVTWANASSIAWRQTGLVQ